MFSYVLFKFIADLGSFYALFGCILGAAGFKPGYAAIYLALQCLAVSVAYFLRSKNILSKLPVALLIAGYFLSAGACNIVLYSLANIYICISIFKQLFYPDWEDRSKILKVTAGLSVALIALISALKAGVYVKTIFVPFVILSLAANAIITRSLRHDPEVYLSKRYQGVNIAGLCGAVLAALALSSDLFIQFVKRLAQIVYGKVLLKILIVIINAFVWVLQAVVKAFSFLSGLIKGNSGTTEVQEINIEISDITESLGTNEVGEGSVIIDYIIYGFLGLIGLLLAYKLLKALLGNKKPQAANYKPSVLRQNIGPALYVQPEFESTNAEKVRKSYKAFLKHYVKIGLPLKKSTTSADINKFGKNIFGSESPAQLRSLYLKARYKGDATKEDAANAKALAKELCKIEEKV